MSTTRTSAFQLLPAPARIQTNAKRSTTPLFPAIVSIREKPGCLSEKEVVCGAHCGAHLLGHGAVAKLY